MRSELEIRKRLSALEGIKALAPSDLKRIEGGIRALEWVLQEGKDCYVSRSTEDMG